jgi:hypothetical protein
MTGKQMVIVVGMFHQCIFKEIIHSEKIGMSGSVKNIGNNS